MIIDAAMSGASAEQFTHRAVLLPEAIEALHIRPDGHYVDATFGRGGHSRAILEKLSENGRLLALDRDPDAIAAGRSIDDVRFVLVHRPFSELAEALSDAGWPTTESLDGILLDIGVSSPQIDSEERGFSFRFNAPLDMRMDTTRGETVADWLTRADKKEIAEVIREYGEERFASAIAEKIVAVRSERPITNTHQLAEIIRSAVRTREPGQDAATRSFQALRIHINQELSQLSLVLPQALAALVPGGRLVVISFHSLEDRIVKRFFSAAARPEAAIPKNLPLRATELPAPELLLCGKAIRPSSGEIAANPRARSAVMRVGEKYGKSLGTQPTRIRPGAVQ